MTSKTLPFPTPLTEKYRPRKVSDFIGLLRPKRVLEHFIEHPFDSSWFFLGASGLGKTTLAMAIGEEINAQIHQIASRACDLEAVEQITKMCHYAAFNFETGKPSARHVVIVNEADQMTLGAQNSFLSKLDATAMPPQTTFFFTANSRQGLEERFLSRCTVIEFTRDSMEEELPGFLAKVYKKEGGRHPLDFEAIAKSSQFNVRDALNKLQIELLIGSDRAGLPTEEIKIVKEHIHDCKKCHKPWKHQDPNCELPYRTVCPECGGSKTVGQERAKKAWVTIKKNIAAELKQKKKKGKAA